MISRNARGERDVQTAQIAVSRRICYPQQSASPKAFQRNPGARLSRLPQDRPHATICRQIRRTGHGDSEVCPKRVNPRLESRLPSC
jgi:hypothetical protein